MNAVLVFTYDGIKCPVDLGQEPLEIGLQSDVCEILVKADPLCTTYGRNKVHVVTSGLDAYVKDKTGKFKKREKELSLGYLKAAGVMASIKMLQGLTLKSCVFHEKLENGRNHAYGIPVDI